MDKQSLGVVVGEYRGIIQRVPQCLCGPHTRMPVRGHTHTQLTYYSVVCWVLVRKGDVMLSTLTGFRCHENRSVEK